MKAPNGELIALAAYKISGRKTYVYILYAESAPHSNATITGKVERKYSGIGAVLLAFGIKYSIDNGCRGDIVFDAKTDELARHYAEVFGAKRISSISSGGPKRFMLADEDAWLLFQNILRRRLKNMKQNDPTYVIDELAERAGGYFAMPTQDDIAYTDLLFDVCRQFGIHYYSATPKEKAFVEEVTRVTWAKEQETLTGVKQDIPPHFLHNHISKKCAVSIITEVACFYFLCSAYVKKAFLFCNRKIYLKKKGIGYYRGI